MEKNGLGKRINAVRKDRGLTADRLSEMCNINATYLRQIEYNGPLVQTKLKKIIVNAWTESMTHFAS